MAKTGAVLANPSKEGRHTRVAIYIRISTDESRQKYSLGAQAEALETLAKSYGWVITETYRDQSTAHDLTGEVSSQR
jgi:predicted site-specific integrase-resolvase